MLVVQSSRRGYNVARRGKGRGTKSKRGIDLDKDKNGAKITNFTIFFLFYFPGRHQSYR